MGGAASRGLKAAPAVVRRAPPSSAAAVVRQEPVAAQALPSNGDASAAPAELDSRPAPTAAEGKDASLDSLMLRLGGAIKGHAVDERHMQARAPASAARIAVKGAGLRVEDVRELYTRHREEKLDAAALAATYGVDAALLARALAAARLPRIRAVPIGSPPVLRRVAED